MSGHRPEVADVFRSWGSHYEKSYGPIISAEQRRVLRDLSRCRTQALGGHRWRCQSCGHDQVAYNSCRNRHCPKCQAAARANWLDARRQELLNVPYCHVVFTLPHQIGPLALQNKRLVYGLLFRAAAETLQAVARNPKHLGAEIGFLAVLHTWGQTLVHHPHLHCLIPAGGLSLHSQRWIPCRRNFFLPVKVLSKLFRGKFLAYLKQVHQQGRLRFDGKLQPLASRNRWKRWIDKLYATTWVVYAKPPFGGPEQLLKYLARYTHRVAISNQRLLSVSDGRVTFRFKDYTQQNRWKTMSLEAQEFIRRFLMHVLPKSFMRIRHFGFLANRCKDQMLPTIRQLLATDDEPQASQIARPADNQTDRCPHCRRGPLVLVETIPPARGPTFIDTS